MMWMAISLMHERVFDTHESKTAFAFDSYLTLYLYVNGVAVSEATDTHTHTHTLSTVTFAAHARRGLITASMHNLHWT